MGRNQVLREDNPGRNPKVIIHGATFADRNTLGAKNATLITLNGAEEIGPTQEEQLKELNTGE